MTIKKEILQEAIKDGIVEAWAQQRVRPLGASACAAIIANAVIANCNKIFKAEDVTERASRWKLYQGFNQAHTIPEWGKLLGIPRHSLSRYIKRGMTIEEAAEYRDSAFTG